LGLRYSIVIFSGPGEMEKTIPRIFSSTSIPGTPKGAVIAVGRLMLKVHVYLTGRRTSMTHAICGDQITIN
jgi:hypothetical protein